MSTDKLVDLLEVLILAIIEKNDTERHDWWLSEHENVKEIKTQVVDALDDLGLKNKFE